MPLFDNEKYGKLYDALELIKIICEQHFEDGCAQCPLGDKSGSCCLKICPKEWRTRHPDTDAFRMID